MRRRRWQVVLVHDDVLYRSVPVSSHWTHKAALRAVVHWMHTGRDVGLTPDRWAIRRTTRSESSEQSE